MNDNPDSKDGAVFAPLPQYSMLSATGADARAFLHAQLSNDVEHLAANVARRAGYCSPKGRLLASFLVVPRTDGFLLQVSRDLAASIAKRLSMYVLRSKVRIADESETWAQYGVWGPGGGARLRALGIEVPSDPMQSLESEGRMLVCISPERYLLLCAPGFETALAGGLREASVEDWNLADVRAGLPQISLPTQDQFVPQMANFELIGGIDFKKGCYPGQEIVARSQYLGKLKRRMYRAEIDAGHETLVAPGRDVFGDEAQPAGMIVSSAQRPDGGNEFLVVMQSVLAESGAPIRLGAPDGPPARILALPYAL